MRFLISIADGLNTLRDLPPLFFRLVLAFGFYGPFMNKVDNIEGFASFLASMHYPIPLVSAYCAMITEGVGILFLFFGFATRFISVFLMFMMVVAIATVHWDNGWKAGNNGFEIPFYYLLMLFSLFIRGPGKISIDALFARPYRKAKTPQV